MSENIEKILNSLIDIREVMENLRTQQEKDELCNANRFNPLRFLKTNENGLSEILAFLLDPKETHGQKDLFLNSFLKYIGKHHFLAYDDINVQMEMLTKRNRRQDIVIEGFLGGKLHWTICIENKLRFAADQTNQLKDYYNDLNSKGTDSCLIYLPVFEQAPSEESIPREDWEKLIQEKKAVLLCAKDLINWLENTPIIAPAVKQFCNYFQHFLSEELMGNTNEKQHLVDYLVNDNEALYSALTIINSEKQIYSKLIDILVEQLQKRFEEKYKDLSRYGWKCNPFKEVGEKYFGIYFDKRDIDWGVGIEFDARGFTDCYYGVYCDQDEHNALYQFLGDVFEEKGIKEHFRSSKYWVIWQWMNSNLLNWNADIFSKIPSGKLADQLFELWKPLFDVITENLDKIRKIEINNS